MKKYLIYSLMSALFLNSSCEKFVKIDAPISQIVSDKVFSDERTAIAAMRGIYNQLRPAFFTAAASTHMGMSGNLIEPRLVGINYSAFYDHEINTIDNGEAGNDVRDNLEIWSSAYNMIYMANSLIEGVQNSSALSVNLANSLKGQALVVRAFTYFYLTNFYGEVPLLLTTDYTKNAVASRVPIEEVWSQIRNDLDEAITLLESDKVYPEGQRFYVTQNVAIALQARVCLYREDWAKAEEYSSQIIQQSGRYELLDDMDEVFLKDSREAIWQIDPIGGTPLNINTAEGRAYAIRLSRFGWMSGNIVLFENFLKEFSADDKRLLHWIGTYVTSDETYPFIHKYKEHASDVNNKESSVVLRLAEQYLIRAEARLHLDKLDLAIKDMDVIRERAGLDLIADTYTEITQEVLLDTIMAERKKELFGEYGHYWLDLKRTKSASEKFVDSPFWQKTDIWYPIPEEERLKNPNLGQNEGY